MDRVRLFALIEDGAVAGKWGGALHRAITITIAVSIVILLLASEDNSFVPAGAVFASEAITFLVFLGEFALRLWTAPDNPRFHRLSAANARLRHLLQVGIFLDLFILAAILAFLVGTFPLASAAALSLARCLKLIRYSSMLNALSQALVLGRQALIASAVIVIMIGLVFGAAIFLLEHQGQPEDFGNLPHTVWWAVSTVTGANNDDASPDTRLGQALYVILSISGFLVLALPMGVIATSFDTILAKRSFVVTWNMVARVPLFRGLSAAAIAAIAEALYAETFAKGAMVIRRGEPGERMYFILTGNVEVITDKGPVRLAAGQFFGEHALLTNEPRSASVAASTDVRLLSLAKRDLDRIADYAPEIAHVLQETDQARQAVR